MTLPEPAANPSQVPAAAPLGAEPADLPIDPGYYAQPTAGQPSVAPAAPTAEFPMVPGQPAYAPAAAPVAYQNPAYPVSSVPVSAYPVSAYPTSGYAGGYPGAPAAAPKRPLAVILLSVTVGVLVLVLGVLTTLFVLKSIDLNDTRAELTGQITERDDKIKLNATEIESLKGQVQRTKDELAVVKRDLEGSENATKDLTAAKAALAECLDKLTEFMASPTQARAKTAETACEAADKFM